MYIYINLINIFRKCINIDPGNITENIILSTSDLNAKIIGKKINK